MTDVLGIKREQIEGVRNPGADLIERIEVDEHHVKRLAQAYLDRQSSARQQQEEGSAAEEAEAAPV